jgi:hypothetical protein
MAENYKHLYAQMKKMVAMYQDELIPGFREKIEDLEADNARLRDMWAEATSELSKEKAKAKHGKWLYYSTTMMECSLCKRHVARHKYEYCPHCGASMEDNYNCC